ncbi:methyltransferase [Ochrobactrum sp. XJ1]|nr:methyltransferase [Ochrobactrum sp. XJ1]
MAKLTKKQRKCHAEAEALLSLDRRLNDEETRFVFDHWHEGADFNNGAAGAFFTPYDLAADFSLEVGAGRIIDLCAGIGALSYFAYHRHQYNGPTQLTCIERNPRYVEVGRKLLPEAEWILADVFDWQDWFYNDLGGEKFDWSIGNPPFGKVRRSGNAPRYQGADFEYHVIDIAAEISESGAFIVPQQSANFRYSGERMFSELQGGRAAKFCKQTGWIMNPGLGIDCSIHKDDWKDTNIITEVVCFEFDEDRQVQQKIQSSRIAAAPVASSASAQQLALF